MSEHRELLNRVGVVVIGRNEGERLKRCLASLADCKNVVYVDSNSSDGSVAFARTKANHVIELDMSLPFSAARARNEGLLSLSQQSPPPEFVQFVDGDCEICSGWLLCAASILDREPRLAVVAGRRRERQPAASVYNRLCDIEWNTPIGEAKTCGGDAMMRLSVLETLNGYDPTVIAGEEPELCVRIRAGGWKIFRIDADMTLHDAAMFRFGQWWRRMERSGHAYAQGSALHGNRPEHHWVREQRSILFWGGGVPLSAIALAWYSGGWSLIAFLGFIALVYRSRKHYLSRGFSRKDSIVAATFNLLAKFPQLEGVLKFHFNHVMSRNTSLIEYKGAAR